MQRFTVNQAHQISAPEPRVRAFLDLLDAEGRPVASLRREQLSATLGRETATLERLESLSESGQGVAYVFLIDISRSLSGEQFERIREALRSWFARLRETDRAAILAFGESSRLVVDFSADRELLARSLQSLGPTDNQTLLHQALKDGLELCQRRDPGLPARRVLVVLTDGRDEGSGLAAEDVLTRLRSEPAPVYAIGYSQLRDPEQRRRFLDLLHRFATVSGGAFFESERDGFALAYEAIREAIHRVWAADLSCPACSADGQLHRLQIDLRTEGRLLSQGTQVRLLPSLLTAAAPEPAAVQPVPAETEPPLPSSASEETAEGAPAPGPESAPSGAVRLAAFALLLLSVAALLLLWRRRRIDSPHPAVAPPQESEEPEAAAPQPVAARSSAPAPIARPVPALSIRFVVVRGSRPGRQYRMLLQDRAVIGARSDCDCVLAEEPGTAPRQFELFQQKGAVYVRNLAESNPTLLDGVPIDGAQLVHNEDLLGTREMILRFVCESLSAGWR